MTPRSAAQRVVWTVAAMFAIVSILGLLLPHTRGWMALALLIAAAVGVLLSKILFRDDPLDSALESMKSRLTPESR